MSGLRPLLKLYRSIRSGAKDGPACLAATRTYLKNATLCPCLASKTVHLLHPVKVCSVGENELVPREGSPTSTSKFEPGR